MSDAFQELLIKEKLLREEAEARARKELSQNELEYMDLVKRLKDINLKKSLSKKRKDAWTGKIVDPSQKGYIANAYPWSFEGLIGGIPQDNIELKLVGYIVKDMRLYPHILIFKNMKIPKIAGYQASPYMDAPVPFKSYREAEIYLEKMHLDSTDLEFVAVTALALEPPPGYPRPNKLIVTDKKHFKNDL